MNVGYLIHNLDKIKTSYYRFRHREKLSLGLDQRIIFRNSHTNTFIYITQITIIITAITSSQCSTNYTCSTGRAKIKLTGSKSSVKFCFNYQPKAVIRALSIIDCSATLHLIPFWWRWRKFWENVVDTLAWKPMSVLSGLAWYVDAKQRWWWR